MPAGIGVIAPRPDLEAPNKSRSKVGNRTLCSGDVASAVAEIDRPYCEEHDEHDGK